ncbi:MAG: SLC13 family permease [Roseicyclus sp.]
MTAPQALIFGILAATLAVFLWGRFRHDVVALAALLACVVAGLVPADAAFEGFGHPAVITVACVLILSQGLQTTGAVDWLARRVMPRDRGRVVSLAALTGLGAALSGVMNNVGAMALLMPVAVQLAQRHGMTPGQMLMPLAFGTILGGTTTVIGTPPNLIVSGFRAEAGMGHFAIFDFAPIGVPLALAGVLFTALVGWRLVPARASAAGERFDTGAYFTELRVPEGNKAVGLTLRAFEDMIETSDAQVVALVRNDVRVTAPHGGHRIRAGDILVLEADVDALAEAIPVFGMKLDRQVLSAQEGEEVPEAGQGKDGTDAPGDADRAGAAEEGRQDIVMRELAVLPGSSLVGRSSQDLHLRTRYGINLLAVSREGNPSRFRLRTLRLKAGDLLLVQGPSDAVIDFVHDTRCVPLGAREIRVPDRLMAILAGAILLGAVGIAAFGLLPAAPAFALGVLASMLTGTVPLRQVYTSVDWPVVVLLAALFPVAGAMQSTGAADLLARVMVDSLAQGTSVGALVVVLVTSMLLSNVMNNAATAAVLCPIALGISGNLGANADGFLMAVAIGASCAFLLPIGHQNNTLILGPGGFRFGDYWRLGLPLQAIVVAIAVPVLLVLWPLS